jgi:hypothetical protein
MRKTAKLFPEFWDFQKNFGKIFECVGGIGG